jgi:peptidase A24-like protein
LGSVLLVGLFVLEHLFDWDVLVERIWSSLPLVLEILAYIGVGLVLVVASFSYGIGTGGVAGPAVLVYVSVLFARALFELRLVYGGADAKALMVAALLAPTFATPLLAIPSNAALILSVYPFVVSVVVNAALLGVSVPIALALRNASRHEFEFPRGFLGFRMAVEDLPRRFVWLKDPTMPPVEQDSESEAQTTAEDVEIRTKQMHDLQQRGIRTVWVTPQIPFLLLLTAGVVTAILAGNLVFDLAAAL